MKANWTKSKIQVLAIALFASLSVAGSSVAGHAPIKGKKPVTTIAGWVVTGGKPVTIVVPRSRVSARVNSKAGFFTIHSPKLGSSRSLIFKRGGKKFLMTLSLPVGGKLTLKDVRLKPKATTLPKLSAGNSGNDGTAEADEEDITVEGTLTSVDCAATPPTVTVTSSDGAIVAAPFDPATTEIIDQQTGVVIAACSDLAALAGKPVEVQVRVDPNGSLLALQILVNPGANQQSDLEFEGTIASTSCPSSFVVTRKDKVAVTVNLSSSTDIQVSDSSNDSKASCTTLGPGMFVKVAGVLQPDGSVNADSVEVRTLEFQADGAINSTNCAATPPSVSFTPDSSTTALTVTIGGGTEIVVNGIDTATCADLTVAPAHVEGVLQPNASVAATHIQQGDQSQQGEQDQQGD